MVTPDQLRAGRALLRWSRGKLAQRAGIALPTLLAIELGHSDPKISTLHKLRAALQSAGVVFIDADETAGLGPGVRLRLKRK